MWRRTDDCKPKFAEVAVIHVPTILQVDIRREPNSFCLDKAFLMKAPSFAPTQSSGTYHWQRSATDVLNSPVPTNVQTTAGLRDGAVLGSSHPLPEDRHCRYSGSRGVTQSPTAESAHAAFISSAGWKRRRAMAATTCSTQRSAHLRAEPHTKRFQPDMAIRFYVQPCLSVWVHVVVVLLLLGCWWWWWCWCWWRRRWWV